MEKLLLFYIQALRRDLSMAQLMEMLPQNSQLHTTQTPYLPIAFAQLLIHWNLRQGLMHLFR